MKPLRAARVGREQGTTPAPVHKTTYSFGFFPAAQTLYARYGSFSSMIGSTFRARLKTGSARFKCANEHRPTETSSNPASRKSEAISTLV